MTLVPGYEDTLALIDALRDRGATSIEVNGIKATFGPPRPKPDDLEPAAKLEREARRGRERTLDEKLLNPLGIREQEPAA